MGLFNSSAQQQQRAQMMLQVEVELQATTELYSKCAPRRLTAVLPQSGLPARPTAAGRVLTRRATYLRSASWLFWGGGVYQAGAALLRQVHQSQIPRRRAHGTYVRTFHGAWCMLHALWMLCATYTVLAICCIHLSCRSLRFACFLPRQGNGDLSIPL
jgi:hypothetical protein